VVTNKQTDRQTNARKNIIPRFRGDNYYFYLRQIVDDTGADRFDLLLKTDRQTHLSDSRRRTTLSSSTLKQLPLKPKRRGTQYSAPG